MAFLGSLTFSALGQSKTLSDRLSIDRSPPLREGPLGGYANIVESVAPAVVSISASKVSPQAVTGPNLFNDPLFRRFFGVPGPDLQPPAPQNRPRQQGLGSGVVLSADGYIVTNNHVVSEADEILVTLSGKREPYPAKVIGQDPSSDLAVLKIDASNLPTVKAADSSVLKVGDTVLAIGNPFGLSQTVTTGIVSALGRDNVSIVDYENFIQTDASINPGNSGGALVDNKGRLIGINTAILSRTGGNVGIGFAIPINMVVNVADQLIEHGEMRRGYLGVMLRELTPDLAEAFDVPADRGVLIDEVFPSTPAEEAGFKQGDVLLKVGEAAAIDVRKVRLLVSNQRPGTKFTMTVLRDGKEMDLDVTFGQLPEDGLAAARSPRAPGGAPAAPSELIDGVKIDELTERYRAQLRLDSSIQGVVVTAVDPNSQAAEKGLQAGDVITEIGRQSVTNLAEAAEARKSVSGDLILLRIWRDGVGRFLALKTG